MDEEEKNAAQNQDNFIVFIEQKKDESQSKIIKEALSFEEDSGVPVLDSKDQKTPNAD